MKICFILPPVNMGGGIKVAAIYAHELTKKGHEVVLVSPASKKVPLRRKIKLFATGKGWPKSRKNPSHLDTFELDHRELNEYRPITENDVPDSDVIIATWWETAEWVSRMSDKKGAKVYFIQGHEVHEHLPVERSRATYYLPFHKIVVSKWLQNIMKFEYGDFNVDLVTNSVDHSHFFSGKRMKQTKPTVGFLYSYTKLKGVDILFNVINKLRIYFPNLRVIVFGSVMPIKDTYFDDRYEFYLSPAQHKIRDLYTQCDIWLSASRSEGFNLPVMEAMACRTPVITTKTGWPADGIVTGKNGALIDIDDADGMTKWASAILSMPDREWQDLSECAYNTVALYSWQDSANQFEESLLNAWQEYKNLSSLKD